MRWYSTDSMKWQTQGRFLLKAEFHYQLDCKRGGLTRPHERFEGPLSDGGEGCGIHFGELRIGNDNVCHAAIGTDTDLKRNVSRFPAVDERIGIVRETRGQYLHGVCGFILIVDLAGVRLRRWRRRRFGRFAAYGFRFHGIAKLVYISSLGGISDFLNLSFKDGNLLVIGPGESGIGMG